MKIEKSAKLPEIITMKQAADMIGVSLGTVTTLYHAGKLKGYRVGEGRTSPIKLYRDSVRDYIKRVQGRTV